MLGRAGPPRCQVGGDGVQRLGQVRAEERDPVGTPVVLESCDVFRACWGAGRAEHLADLGVADRRAFRS
jgi:hypothetical protein